MTNNSLQNEIDIQFQNCETFVDLPSEEQIRRTCDMVLQAEGIQDCILSVVICDDDFILPLNRDFRGKDKPTDVLSFAQREGDFANKEDPLLGDVIVSFETTCRQSVEHNQTTTQELELLLTHGILHLLGYDHIEDEDAVVMEERERIILESIRNP